MAKREDIRKILIIGSGPIIIGQACEFDYSSRLWANCTFVPPVTPMASRMR